MLDNVTSYAHYVFEKDLGAYSRNKKWLEELVSWYLSIIPKLERAVVELMQKYFGVDLNWTLWLKPSVDGEGAMHARQN